MSDFTGSAIILRRIEYGDSDLILTFLTQEEGKGAAIAKSAKRSVKRFGGVLEPFSLLQVVWKQGRAGLPILQEASLRSAFFNIRGDIRKTAYASYWTGLVHEWTEEGPPQESLFELLRHVLFQLDQGGTPPEALSILFQMRFAALAGYRPQLTRCSGCGTTMEDIPDNHVVFDIHRGGIFCKTCQTRSTLKMFLSKGTIKQLLWTTRGDCDLAGRIRFSERSIQEGMAFLETFLPYQLGKQPKSLEFLHKIRKKTKK